MPVSKVKAKTEKLKTKDVKVVAKPAKSGLTVDVFDTKGKMAGKVSLTPEIFGAKINTALMSQAVRVYLANQRAGSAHTKSRGEVNLTKAKAWRQKGTGRARHGAKSAPIWVGGGIAHGPKPHDFSLKLSKKMKRLALFSALTSKKTDGEIKIVAGFATLQPKTKIMAKTLSSLDSAKKRKVLLVLPAKNDTIERGARNIEGVTIKNANLLTTYDVLNTKMLLLMKESLETLEKTFLKK
ncbi:MAG TPA: 50S ribosomal protein L4 [Candidatus Saccharimonadales bacterium]|nr:50S ribosomal protein L4 [Candidatus Saccharimonadales bacterium]